MACSRREMETDVCALYDANEGNMQPTAVTTFMSIHAACIANNSTNFVNLIQTINFIA